MSIGATSQRHAGDIHYPDATAPATDATRTPQPEVSDRAKKSWGDKIRQFIPGKLKRLFASRHSDGAGPSPRERATVNAVVAAAKAKLAMADAQVKAACQLARPETRESGARGNNASRPARNTQTRTPDITTTKTEWEPDDKRKRIRVVVIPADGGKNRRKEIFDVYMGRKQYESLLSVASANIINGSHSTGLRETPWRTVDEKTGRKERTFHRPAEKKPVKTEATWKDPDDAGTEWTETYNHETKVRQARSAWKVGSEHGAMSRKVWRVENGIRYEGSEHYVNDMEGIFYKETRRFRVGDPGTKDIGGRRNATSAGAANARDSTRRTGAPLHETPWRAADQRVRPETQESGIESALKKLFVSGAWKNFTGPGNSSGTSVNDAAKLRETPWRIVDEKTGRKERTFHRLDEKKPVKTEATWKDQGADWTEIFHHETGVHVVHTGWMADPMGKDHFSLRLWRTENGKRLEYRMAYTPNKGLSLKQISTFNAGDPGKGASPQNATTVSAANADSWTGTRSPGGTRRPGSDIVEA